MSHLPKMLGFGERTRGVCDCGYMGTPTAIRLHMKAKHSQKKGMAKANQSCRECGVVVPGGDKELIRHINVFHNSESRSKLKPF